MFGYEFNLACFLVGFLLTTVIYLLFKRRK